MISSSFNLLYYLVIERNFLRIYCLPFSLTHHSNLYILLFFMLQVLYFSDTPFVSGEVDHNQYSHWWVRVHCVVEVRHGLTLCNLVHGCDIYFLSFNRSSYALYIVFWFLSIYALNCAISYLHCVKKNCLGVEFVFLWWKFSQDINLLELDFSPLYLSVIFSCLMVFLNHSQIHHIFIVYCCLNLIFNVTFCLNDLMILLFESFRSNPVQSVERMFQLSRANKELVSKSEYDVQVGLV